MVFYYFSNLVLGFKFSRLMDFFYVKRVLLKKNCHENAAMCSIFECTEPCGHVFKIEQNHLNDLHFGQSFAKENLSIQ